MPRSQKPPIIIYLAGVCVVWAAVLVAVWFLKTPRFHEVALFCGGFFVGMFAMYVAVHVYRFK